MPGWCQACLLRRKNVFFSKWPMQVGRSQLPAPLPSTLYEHPWLESYCSPPSTPAQLQQYVCMPESILRSKLHGLGDGAGYGTQCLILNVEEMCKYCVSFIVCADCHEFIRGAMGCRSRSVPLGLFMWLCRYATSVCRWGKHFEYHLSRRLSYAMLLYVTGTHVLVAFCKVTLV